MGIMYFPCETDGGFLMGIFYTAGIPRTWLKGLGGTDEFMSLRATFHCFCIHRQGAHFLHIFTQYLVVLHVIPIIFLFWLCYLDTHGRGASCLCRVDFSVHIPDRAFLSQLRQWLKSGSSLLA